MDRFTVGLWAVLVVGFIPALYFAATFRPRLRRLYEGADVAGFVAVLSVLYARQMVFLVLGREQQRDTTRIVIYVALDVLLWVRAVRWYRLRRTVARFGVPRRRSTDR